MPTSLRHSMRRFSSHREPGRSGNGATVPAMGSVAGSVLRTGRSSADAERLTADSNRSLRKRNRSLDAS
jgi:hypothetical protein